jgi:formiminotetrahydrofolate cyclodeaminase
MSYIDKSCVAFTEALASRNPVPGGGGAAALVGALGVACGTMVANLTIGKKKYAEHEARLKELVQEGEALQQRLLAMVDEDAEHFIPLSKAYGLPQTTDAEKAHRAQVLEEALKVACQVPIEIVRYCHKAIQVQADLVDRGSRLVISDVGCGVQLLKAALNCGELNVRINMGMIKDQEFVAQVQSEMQVLVSEGGRVADEVYRKVEQAIA